MADNLLISTGTGTTIATDQVGTAHYQRIKIAVGGADTANHLVFGQTAGTYSLPVVIANDQSTLNVAVVAFTPGGTQSVTVVNTPTVTVSTGSISIAAGTVTRVSVVDTLSSITTILALPVLSASNVSIASITAGTLDKLALCDTVSTVGSVTTILALPVISASNVSIASITAGTLDKIAVVGTVSTILALPVLSASNVSIASITAGTLDKLALCDTVSTVGTILTLPVISGTGLLLGATTAKVGAFVATAHGSAWNGYAVSTTSGAATILKTSGGHTLYVTDLLFSVDVPMNIDIRSATTVKATVYLATKGGFVFPTATPMILNSAESLTFQPSASGSCAGYAAGYTVT